MEEREVVPDLIACNILKAFNLRDEMLCKGIQPTQVTYTSLVYDVGKERQNEKADELFERVEHEGFVPDIVMFKWHQSRVLVASERVFLVFWRSWTVEGFS